MTTTLIIIGWLACGAITLVILAREDGQITLQDATICAVFGCLGLSLKLLSYCNWETVIWRRKPDDQSREK